MLLAAACLGFMTYFIVRADAFLPSVKNGLNLYVTAVLPSMLPFFFFSKLLTEFGFASDCGKVFKKPVAFLFHAPPLGAYVLIMSMLCGYPVGAKLVGECFEQGFIDEKQAKKIAAFTSTSGPLFIVGTVGVTMFADKKAGVILLVSHYLGTLANGLFYRGKKASVIGAIPSVLPADDVLNKVMLNTVLSVGLVGGYICLFNLFSDAATLCGLIPLLSKVFAAIGVDTRITSGVAGGLFEMTRGCLTLSQSGLPRLITLPLCEWLITFGGMSVTLQSLTFLSKTKISPAYYLLVKGTQGIVCSLICLLIVYLFSYA